MSVELLAIDSDMTEALKYLAGVDRTLFQLHHDTDGEYTALESAKAKFDLAYCLLLDCLKPLDDDIAAAQDNYAVQAAQYD